MSDDGRNEEVITLESQDIEIQELPEFPDREEFVKTQEMDGPPVETRPQPSRDALSTRPMQPVLDRTTQRYEVPDSLLEQARRTQIVEDGDWIEFRASADAKGRIRLPEQVRRALSRGELLIRVRPIDPSDK
jgi:hypothetical protein